MTNEERRKVAAKAATARLAGRAEGAVTQTKDADSLIGPPGMTEADGPAGIFAFARLRSAGNDAAVATVQQKIVNAGGF